MVKTLDGSALDRKIRAAGWNFFFIASQVKVMFLGALEAKKIQHALNRILGKISQQHFNGLEVTGIVAKRFLGLPYAIVSALRVMSNKAAAWNNAVAGRVFALCFRGFVTTEAGPKYRLNLAHLFEAHEPRGQHLEDWPK